MNRGHIFRISLTLALASLMFACGEGMVGGPADCPSGDCGYANGGGTSGGGTGNQNNNGNNGNTGNQNNTGNNGNTGNTGNPKNPKNPQNNPPPPPLKSCTKDAECTSPYVCHTTAGKCVPPAAKGSGTCDPIEGKNCGAGYQCISGVCIPPPGKCSSNDQCPIGWLCIKGQCKYDNNSGKPMCTNNLNCPSGQVCVNGLCKTKKVCKIPGIFNRLKGNWRLDSKLHVRDGLKGLTKGLLNAATLMQNIIDGKFTIKGVPSFVTSVLTSTLQGMIHKYVPPWGKQVIAALANVNDAIDDTRVISIESLQALGNAQYVGNSSWILIEFEYKGVKVSTNPANTPALGKVTTTSYTAREICGTLYLDKHKVKNHIGKIYRWAIEAVITGVTCSMKNVPCYKSISQMLNDLVRCQQLGNAMGNSSQWPGVGAAVAAACTAQKQSLIKLLLKELDELTAKLTYMSLKAKADVPNNNQLKNGKWYGVLGGAYSKGNFEGTFKGHRVP